MHIWPGLGCQVERGHRGIDFKLSITIEYTCNVDEFGDEPSIDGKRGEKVTVRDGGGE